MGIRNDPSPELTVSSGYIKAIFENALTLGVDESLLNGIIGEHRTLLEMSTKRVPYDVLLNILESTADHLGNDSVGIELGRRVRAERHIDVIYSTTFCQDLEQALRLNITFQALIHEIGQTSLKISDNKAILSWRTQIANSKGLEIFVETIFTSYIIIGRWLAWKDWLPILIVKLRRDPPPDLVPYTEMFGENIEFNAAQDELILDANALRAEIPTRNPELLKRLKSVLEQKLNHLKSPNNFTQDVKDHIATELVSGTVKLKAVLIKLGISERTLRRRLSQENTSYSELLNTMRVDLASIYMMDKNLSLTQIAKELGYSDQSAFSRAFKSWMNMTPQAYRKQLLEM